MFVLVGQHQFIFRVGLQPNKAAPVQGRLEAWTPLVSTHFTNAKNGRDGRTPTRFNHLAINRERDSVLTILPFDTRNLRHTLVDLELLLDLDCVSTHFQDQLVCALVKINGF